MFDRLAHSYRRIVKSIAIIGYDEEKIKERGIKKENLDFQCLFKIGRASCRERV